MTPPSATRTPPQREALGRKDSSSVNGILCRELAPHLFGVLAYRRHRAQALGLAWPGGGEGGHRYLAGARREGGAAELRMGRQMADRAHPRPGYLRGVEAGRQCCKILRAKTLLHDGVGLVAARIAF